MEFGRRRNELESKKMRLPSMTCKIKSHSESVVVAPIGPSDNQISSSGQQKWSAQMRVRQNFWEGEESLELRKNISKGSFL